ncbi:MAG: Gfo/Idh/MocA family protein [Candidatus Brocadiia bacterium]
MSASPKRGPAALSRRRFLGSLAAPAAFAVVPRHVLGGPEQKPPSDTLDLAAVGLGAMGADNLAACEGENVAALCDVDWAVAAVTFQRYPKAKRYRDFRRMLDAEKGLDALIVATPDHTHAPITAAAMRLGKHVYTQMPLAHDVWEARQLAQLAEQSGVATQMGNERYSGPTLRTTVEWIQDGCVGPVREVHCWTNRPRWPQGLTRPNETPPVPAHLDWDLWLGPAPERPYHPAYHPYQWRGWRDFGTGALGAMGCHVMDGAYWALKLAEAPTFTVEADSEGGTAESYPRAATVRYRFPARGQMPPVTLVWYDGGRRPPRPEELPDTRQFLGSNGTIFVGEKGKLTFGALTAGTHPGQAGPRFIPESLRGSYRPAKKTIPRVKGKGRWVKGSRHEEEWLRACKGGRPACSRFQVAGPLTEMALLGNVALACGKPIEYDRQTLRVVNEPAANELLRRDYRPGWKL